MNQKQQEEIQMRDFELWLDESGDFEAETQRNTKLNPSLIGGILIEKNQFTNSDITRFVADEKADGTPHAMCFDRPEMRDIVIPALEHMCSLGGRLVYFENRERIDTYSVRELYLRLMAHGLVQLIRFLSREGAFVLDVMIAARYEEDADEKGRLELIDDSEYLDMLRRYMQDELEEDRLELIPGCMVNMCILSARAERRLMLADYACNARLTRHSERKFDADMRGRLEKLFDEDYIYSARVQSSESRILSRLAAGNAASALSELYTGRGRMDHEQMLHFIIEKLLSIPASAARTQLNIFASLMSAKSQQEQDYERTEASLRKILEELFPYLEQENMGFAAKESRFMLLNSLCQMYLREGDIRHAGPVLKQMEQVTEEMRGHMECVQYLFAYRETKALWLTDCMEYEKAAALMQETELCISDLAEMSEMNDMLHEFLGDAEQIRSDVLGRAVTMKIFAGMHLIRFRDDWYGDELAGAAKRALRQFASDKETEWLRLYSVFIETERSRFNEALRLLTRMRNIVPEEGKTAEACRKYLLAIQDENHYIRPFYVMYYIILMQEASLMGEDEIARGMFSALSGNRELMEEFVIENALATDMRSDRQGHEPDIHENIVWNMFTGRPGVYHPAEVILWKFGAYMLQDGQAYEGGTGYLDRAIAICDNNHDYTEMKVIGVAIRLEKLFWRSKRKDVKAKDVRKIRSIIKEISGEGELTEKMSEFLRNADDVLARAENADNINEDGIMAEVFSVSRNIVY